MMTDHARISPSALSRTLACPASVQLSAGMPDNASFAAAEGTVTHAMAEHTLTAPPQKNGDRFKHLYPVGQVVWQDDFAVTVTDEMQHAAEAFTKRCRPIKLTSSAYGVEYRTNISAALWPGDPNPPEAVFGTVDFWAVKGRTLHVVDLKYGLGFVRATDNPQLLAYALGACVGREVDEVVMTIVQPRAPDRHGDTVRSVRMELPDLLSWGWGTLLPAVMDALGPNPTLASAGDHCRWCPAAGACPSMAAKVAQDIEDTFAVIPEVVTDKTEVGHISDDVLGVAIRSAKQAAALEKALVSEARRRMDKGHSIPGLRQGASPQASEGWADEASSWAKVFPEITGKNLIQHDLPAPEDLQAALPDLYEELRAAGHFKDTTRSAAILLDDKVNPFERPASNS